MKITNDHNNTTLQGQEFPIDPALFSGVDRRGLFRLWQLTPSGKTLRQLGKILGITGSAVSQMLNKDRMPVKHHTSLLKAGVPASLLPVPKDVKRGVKPRS